MVRRDIRDRLSAILDAVKEILHVTAGFVIIPILAGGVLAVAKFDNVIVDFVLVRRREIFHRLAGKAAAINANLRPLLPEMISSLLPL